MQEVTGKKGQDEDTRDEEKKLEEESEMGRGGGVQLDVVAARSGMRFAHSFVSVCLKPGPNVRSQSWNK